MQRVSFKTVGCRLNQAETAQIAAQFEAAGYMVVPFGQPCDVCVVHTCTITREAERKCLQYARTARRASPDTFVILAGCAVNVEPDRLRRTGVDLLAGQEDKFCLPRLIREARGDAEDQAGTPSHSGIPCDTTPVFETTRAFVKAQDGCSFCCSYCIVPQARGAPHSRPVKEVVSEVASLAAKGYREVVLTGANLGCYENGGDGLVELLKAVEPIDDLARIRVSSIELSTTERALIEFMAGSQKLCNYLHFPLQSGDDRILSAMRRRYTAASFREVVQYASECIPLLGLGTDIITGFPGEDEKAFQNTRALVEELPFTNLHVFPYSKRPGTSAEQMPDQVTRPEKKQRVNDLITIGAGKQAAFADSLKGQQVQVLIENISPDGLATGWTRNYLRAKLPADNLARNQLITFTVGGTEAGTLLP